MNSNDVTLQTILRATHSSYRRTRRLRSDVLHALNKVLNCRTPALGTHIERCDCGHISRIEYNSCRHRCCPQCRGGPRAKCLARLADRLLPCDHVHVIFTVPEELNVVWQFNREEFAECLFECSRRALLDLLGDEKYLGAQPGIISALHTWGRNLSVHPHIHCLVTAGGLDKSGRFVEQSRGTLLPTRVLMAVFRGKLREALLKAAAAEKLQLPESLSRQRFATLLNRLGREDWNVRVQSRYRHGVSVAGYLARYVTGGPISNGQLISASPEQVVFTYRDHRAGQQQLLPLTPEAFLDRWCQHVPPKHLRMLRYSGLYANCHSGTRTEIKQRLLAEAPEREQPTVSSLETEVCPVCNTPVTACAPPTLPPSQPDRKCRRLTVCPIQPP